MLSFSIIINTLNRCELLANTLDSFKWLKYSGDFEVIVVNGPSTDNTEQVLASLGDKIRVGNCEVANLSISRNIGICMAQGDVVAFIDDDAIPEPEWLGQLAQAYSSAEIGGVGGIVYNHTGYSYQYEFSTANRLGQADWSAGTHKEHYCYPGAIEFPYLQGTNASFRRSALLEIGGFDEEFEFYLDETDVCCRLVDAGYIIKQLSTAFVHHKFAPSNIRDDHKILRHRYPVIKNKIYFSLKHGREYWSLSCIQADNAAFIAYLAEDMAFHISEGRLDVSEKERFAEECDKAKQDGLSRGMSSRRDLITPSKREKWYGKYQPFHTIGPENYRVIVMISRDFIPEHSGAKGAFTKEFAELFAAEGHILHVVTESPDINRVDFEQGVWVHRVVAEESELPDQILEVAIPQKAWNWSAAALKETVRISMHHLVDVVEVPIRDGEGAAFLKAHRWPLLVRVKATHHSYPRLGYSTVGLDTEWLRSFGCSMQMLEKKLLQKADAVRVISKDVQTDNVMDDMFVLGVKGSSRERMIQESHVLYDLAAKNFAKVNK